MVLSYKSSTKCGDDGGGNGKAASNGGGFWLLVLLLDEKASKHSLLKRAQSTIWVCLFILAFTLAVFMLCGLDSVHNLHRHSPPPPPALPKKWRPVKPPPKSRKFHYDRSLALHGLGSLFHRGSFAMNELVVVHMAEATEEEMLRFFVRSAFRSGVMFRADMVLLFPSSSLSFSLQRIVSEESGHFVRLMTLYNNSAKLSPEGINPIRSHPPTNSDEKKKPSIWGTSGISNNNNGVSLGSVVGFDVSELNPENSFSGFIDDAPIELRRWVCYQMLLGRLRHRFKHVALIDVERVLVVGDIMAGFRRKGDRVDGLKLLIEDEKTENCRRALHPHKSESLYKETWLKGQKWVNSAIVLGPMTDVRRLVSSMITEIVRVAVRRKSRRPFDDNQLLTYVAKGRQDSGNAIATESTGNYYYNSTDTESTSSRKNFILYGDDQNGLGKGFRSLVGLVHNEVCSYPIDASVYRDCLYAYTPHS